MKSRGGVVTQLQNLLPELGRPIPDSLKKSNEPKIAYGELYAIYKAVQLAPNGSRMLLRVDNVGVIGGLEKGRFRDESLNILLGLVLEELTLGHKFLSTQWVPTTTMARLGPDAISRNNFPVEGYTISSVFGKKLQQRSDAFFGVLESKIIIGFKIKIFF